jgi:hypothetical protein
MGEFEHLPSDIIKINGCEFSLDTFLAIEPEYTLPKGAISRFYNSDSHHFIFTKDTQYSGVFPWEDGERYVNRVFDLKFYEEELKDDAKYVEEIIKEEELKNQIISERKDKEYSNKSSKMIIALWKHIVEKKDLKESGIEDLIKEIKMEDK